MAANTHLSGGLKIMCEPTTCCKIVTSSGVVKTSEGVKFDQDKVPLDLLPVDSLWSIAKVLAFGAKKYGAHNWAKGMAWSRVYGALLRHITQWWQKEESDIESGMSHLWHAGCCILFLIAFELRKIGKDDRP
jgi:hypothetical protein